MEPMNIKPLINRRTIVSAVTAAVAIIFFLTVNPFLLERCRGTGPS